MSNASIEVEARSPSILELVFRVFPLHQKSSNAVSFAMPHVIVWTYEVAPERRNDFCRVYGPNGDWARLFARAPGFLGVELLFEGVRYLTIDRWASGEAFEAFKSQFGDEYAELDAKCAGLTLSESKLGAFDTA
jgi:heme-degrading monooxygenase HmoA